jgi:hypothetical protein
MRTTVLVGVTSLLAASATVLASPASAAPTDCTTGLIDSTSAYAECPADAGDFEFRVVAQSGGIAGYHTVYGTWQRPAPDAPVRSTVVCEGVPKCAIFSPSIEFR